MKISVVAGAEAAYGRRVARCAIGRWPSRRAIAAFSTFVTLLIGVLTIVSGHPRAQTISSLANTGSAAQMTFDGLTFSVGGCNVALCNDVKMEAESANGGATIEFLGNDRGSNGSNIFVATNGPAFDMLGFTLTVSGIGANKISSVTSTVGGSYSGGGEIGSFLTISGTGPCTTGWYGHGGCEMLAMGGRPSWADFGPVSSLSVQYELGAYSAGGQTIILSNASQKFAPATEPGTLGLMATAMAGLAAAQLHRRRRLRLQSADH